MEKQVLVLQFVGEEPTPQQAANAVVALQKSGCFIDTTVQPTMCLLNEKEQAMAMSMFAQRKSHKGEGITIKVENPEPRISADKAQRLAAVLRDFLENE
jgi:hypothetical protein